MTWHLIETPTLLEIRDDLNGRPAGIALRIGSTAMSFRPRRRGTRRGERMAYGTFSEVDRERARLLALAPKLLEACKAALAQLNAEYPPESIRAGNWPTIGALLERINAVIAEVEGK